MLPTWTNGGPSRWRRHRDNVASETRKYAAASRLNQSGAVRSASSFVLIASIQVGVEGILGRSPTHNVVADELHEFLVAIRDRLLLCLGG